jgi:hypothetical protein
VWQKIYSSSILDPDLKQECNSRIDIICTFRTRLVKFVMAEAKITDEVMEVSMGI